jgi:hypothetical protein
MIALGAKQAAERLVEDAKSLPQALKRNTFGGLAARLKSGPSQDLRESEFFRNSLKPRPSKLQRLISEFFRKL